MTKEWFGPANANIWAAFWVGQFGSRDAVEAYAGKPEVLDLESVTRYFENPGAVESPRFFEDTGVYPSFGVEYAYAEGLSGRGEGMLAGLLCGWWFAEEVTRAAERLAIRDFDTVLTLRAFYWQDAPPGARQGAVWFLGHIGVAVEQG